MKPIIFQHESASVKLIQLGPELFALSNLWSQKRGLGHAKAVMRKALAYADERGAVVKLLVLRYGYSDNKALDNIQLESFYYQFGFVKDVGTHRPISMTRPASQKLHGS